MAKEAPISLDMTKAKTLEPIPARTQVLAAMSAWKAGPSKSSGDLSLHYEVTVVEPAEFAKRKILEDTSLVNEYGLGRLQTLLIALGWSKEDVQKSDFNLPGEKDILGLQLTCNVGVQAETPEYPAKNRIGRVMPAEVFSADK